MPDEIDVPTEHLHETLHEKAHGAGDPWLLRVALSAAVLSVLAAIAATISGHYVNEAMLEQITASDTWAHYQAKSIKAAVLNAKMEVLDALAKPIAPEDTRKLADYAREQGELSAEAKATALTSAHAFARHEKFAVSVTAFQIAISICAISALTGSRWLWRTSLVVGGIGVGLLLVQWLS